MAGKLCWTYLLFFLWIGPVQAQKKISPDSLKKVLASQLYQKNFDSVVSLADRYIPGFDKYSKKDDTAGYHCLYLTRIRLLL